MHEQLRIGLIGLDTSHAGIYANLLNNKSDPYHVPGGQVTVAFSGGSPDFELSISRVAKFTERIRDEFGARIVECPEQVAEQSDAILLLSGDGRVHLEQFRRISPYGKPVYIDKPLAVTTREASEIFRLAAEQSVPLLSSSPSRYAEPLRQALRDGVAETAIGVDAYGPMTIEPTQGGYFWYGIHSIEMLYVAMGVGCREVTAIATEDHDKIVGVWRDGRIGTVRGNRRDNRGFGLTIHGAKSTQFVDILAHPKPRHACLLEEAMEMFRTRRSPLPPGETLEIVRFIEAANESRKSGRRVAL